MISSCLRYVAPQVIRGVATIDTSRRVDTAFALDGLDDHRRRQCRLHCTHRRSDGPTRSDRIDGRALISVKGRNETPVSVMPAPSRCRELPVTATAPSVTPWKPLVNETTL